MKKSRGLLKSIQVVIEYLFLYYFCPYTMKKIIEQDRKRRKGECKQCATCCRDVLGIDITCPFLRGNLCRIYKWRRHIPIMSAICPIHPLELYHRPERTYCGFYYKDEEEK